MTARQRMQAVHGAYQREFAARPQAVCAAPGRVNLIGEHIDYAGGSVLPFAIQYGISIAAGRSGKRSAGRLCLAPDSPVQPDNAQLVMAQRLAGEVIARLAGRAGSPASSLADWQICVWSDLPLGAGLSSSAAFCVAVAGAVGGIVSPVRAAPAALALCQLCRDAEETATGLQCGLMDQYAIVFGKAGHAVHLDTLTLTHDYVPLELPDALLAVIDSGQARTLADSAYNARRAGLAAGRPDLVRHVESEKLRVAEVIGALAARDMPRLGRLLNWSHGSLSVDYEVSTLQLDYLQECLAGLPEPPLAWRDKLRNLILGPPPPSRIYPAYGARLTGAGFGGNVLALLRPAALEPGADGLRPIDRVLTSYGQRTGLRPELRLVEPSAGAQLAGTAGAGQALLEVLT